MLPRPVKAVVFDMDGLLFDTEALYAEAMVATAAEMGTAAPPEVIRSVIGLPVEASQAVWARHFGPGFDVADFRARVVETFHVMAETQLRVKAGVAELLDLLDRLDMSRAIATSTGRPLVDLHLATAGLAARFDAVIAHGDYAQGKPHPAPYLIAAARLGIAPVDCLALEDSHNGVRSAAAAGMMTVMVPDMLTATEEMRGLALHIARDLHEVAEMLRGAVDA